MWGISVADAFTRIFAAVVGCSFLILHIMIFHFLVFKLNTVAPQRMCARILCGVRASFPFDYAQTSQVETDMLEEKRGKLFGGFFFSFRLQKF